MFHLLGDVFKVVGGLSPTRALDVHPAQLSRWLEELWGTGPGKITTLPAPLPAAEHFLGNPGGIVQALDIPGPGNLSIAGPSGIDPSDPAKFTGNPGPGLLVAQPIWHHLIYAYLLENTGVVEIFGEVIRRAAAGESLDLQGPTNQAVQWLRATEDLFFRDPAPYSITGVTSQLRPEARVVRRNAYWRMFGMDLAHPLGPRGAANGSGQEWKQHTGNGVNTTFREKWAELLRQVWLGYENRNNAVGSNATDNAYLQLLCHSLQDMMNMRRRAGFLAREEFASVALLSWFELTLSEDTPIVQALNAQATGKADRLALVARQVGMTPAPRSRELFELAELMSVLLRVIEAGVFSKPELAAMLYKPAVGSNLADTVNRIVDLWQSATGERVKDRPVGNVVTAGPAQPLRIPDSQPLSVPRLVPRTAAGGRS
jgi:hypothetical protein